MVYRILEHTHRRQGMRTNIDIDDTLLAEAMRATGLTTKKATVEEGLRRLAEGHRYARTLALRGRVTWEGDLEAMRIDQTRSPKPGLDPAAPLGAAKPARRRK